MEGTPYSETAFHLPMLFRILSLYFPENATSIRTERPIKTITKAHKHASLRTKKASLRLL